MYRGITITLRNLSAVLLALILVAATVLFAAAEQEDQAEMSTMFPGMITESQIHDLAGNWTLILDGDVTRELELTFHQTDKYVFGYGFLTFDNTTQKVTAGGFVEGDDLNIYLLPVEGDFMFRLAFTIEDKSISGLYEGYYGDGTRMSGEGSGSMNVEDTTEQPFGFTPKKDKKSDSGAGSSD